MKLRNRTPWRRTAALLALLLAAGAAIAQSYTISGTVRDANTGETLIGATVYDMVSGKGALTNNYGRYSLTLHKGEVRLRFSYVGYATQLDTFQLDGTREYNVSMQSGSTLKAVTVTADKLSSPKSSQMSAVVVPVEHIKAVPALFGETDVLKALQLLPGVQSGTEGMSGIYVRGGGPDENLFLLDGVPLYNVNHLGGFFSAFNADAIKNVTLYKGSFPAHFSGRLSSVLDITTNDGNYNEIHGSVTVGDIAAKVNLEGPIIKNKTTFNVSARRTYADVLIQPMIMSIGLIEGGTMNMGYYFYDFNAKVTHKFSENSRLIGSFYMGDDVIYARLRISEYDFSEYKDYLKIGYNWGNIVASLRWNYVLNPKLFMNVTGSYTRYRNDISMGVQELYAGVDGYSNEEYNMSYNSGIRDLAAQVDFSYHPNPDHDIKFGGTLMHHVFRPEVTGLKYIVESEDYTDPEDNEHFTLDTVVGESVVHANEMTAFIEDDWSITEAVKINMGLNLSAFAVQDKFYPSLQPRLSGRFLLTDDLSVKVGYAYMTQYMHLLSNSSISLPSDLWVPVTARITPMHSHQIAAGVAYSLTGIVDLSVEGYYKRMSNLLEYKDGASFFSSTANWEDKVCMGEGWAYGVEFLAQRTIGDFTGWLGYTWSHTMRLFDRQGQELNNGDPFPAKYDRRHDISIMVSYKPNKEFDCSFTWVFCSGNVATLAMQRFEDPDHMHTYSDNGAAFPNVDYINSRNNFRLPAYHRMDVGMNFHKQKKHGLRTWSFSVYNLYNRKNPFIAYRRSGPYQAPNGQVYGSSLVSLSLFPIIPSVSYTFKF